jgi:hypothetical protein
MLTFFICTVDESKKFSRTAKKIANDVGCKKVASNVGCKKVTSDIDYKEVAINMDCEKL